jgi:hypothetical protein
MGGKNVTETPTARRNMDIFESLDQRMAGGNPALAHC